MIDATMNCQRCGGPTKGQNVFKSNHRHFPDCIVFLLKYISELEPRAAFGDQCYQDRCENAFVEQTIVKRLDREIARLIDVQRLYKRQIKDQEEELEKHSTSRVKHRKALREIAFWLPTVCYEHDDRRYCDIEDVYAMKRIAADARDERKPE